MGKGAGKGEGKGAMGAMAAMTPRPPAGPQRRDQLRRHLAEAPGGT